MRGFLVAPFRHRLVVPKYNPARTFTEEGTVGLGGAYMCIYPMDSPGGYQLVGRTLPIWNTWGRVEPFSPEAPWLLRIFDQVHQHAQHALDRVLHACRAEPGAVSGAYRKSNGCLSLLSSPPVHIARKCMWLCITICGILSCVDGRIWFISVP